MANTPCLRSISLINLSRFPIITYLGIVDAPYALTPMILLTVLEVNIGIINACLPTVNAIFSRRKIAARWRQPARRDLPRRFERSRDIGGASPGVSNIRAPLVHGMHWRGPSGSGRSGMASNRKSLHPSNSDQQLVMWTAKGFSVDAEGGLCRIRLK